MNHYIKICLLSIFLVSCSSVDQNIDRKNISNDIDHKFTIAVIPDTQNYVDFTHQKSEGFAIDSAKLFIQQMKFIAENAVTNGGDIAFATSVGDVWQHTDIYLDKEHEERGINPLFYSMKMPIEKVRNGISDFELPTVRKGYNILANSDIPFGVAPGNHDYDTAYYINPFPGESDPLKKAKEQNITVSRHFGGFKTFSSVFGADSPYFKNNDWYVGSYRDGFNSAQIFEAGGYKFLHLSFEMQAGDNVLKWAQSVIDKYSGIPTIMSTHDFLNPQGERKPHPISDLAKDDPVGHNHAEEIWNDFLKTNDQIFMVLSGHQIGQSINIDQNNFGHDVYQILSDFQGRGQAANPPENAERVTGIGDGWLRLMEFDTGKDIPEIAVKTYSTYYQKFSTEFEKYAEYYKNIEQPKMSDNEFHNADNFVIKLTDFRERFGAPQ